MSDEEQKASESDSESESVSESKSESESESESASESESESESASDPDPAPEPSASQRLRPHAPIPPLVRVKPPAFERPPMPAPVTLAITALSFIAFYTLIVFPLFVAPRYTDMAPRPPAATQLAPTAAPAASADAEAPAPALDAGAPSFLADEGGDAGTTMPFRVKDLASQPDLEIVEGTVGHRALATALASASVSAKDVARILKAFSGIHDFGRTHPSDAWTVARKKAGRHLVAFEYQSEVDEILQAREDAEGKLEGASVALPISRKVIAVGLAVTKDLRSAVLEAGLDDDLLEQLDDALDGHVELSSVRAGARFRVVAREERVAGAFLRYAEVDAVEYTPAQTPAPPPGTAAPAPPGEGIRGPIRVYYAGKGLGFYDAKGRQPSHGGWRTPVPFARIASRFNPKRMHPVLHRIMPHNGVDFAAATGTPVYATSAGTVVHAGDGGPCGNMVKIQHANGLVSAYCHLSRIAAGVHPGLHVEVRQLVGYVGQTGRATGPHLHFAIKRGETFLDPLSLKLDGVRVVPPKDRDTFEARRRELDAALDAIALPGEPAAGASGSAAENGGEDAGTPESDEILEEDPASE